MANSPRPGVIQLDHPNVFMAAKEAQKDDWLRRGITLTGDIAGEALTKRNQDIRYRRAAGLDDDRRTNGEVAGDLANGAWEGVKKLGSGLASVGEGAWGLLKAPFTEDVVTEKSYEEGVKTERPLFQGEMSQEDPFSGGMSREQTMSLAEPEPSDAVAVSFPTTVVGKDRVVEPTRREVGGKFDWDFPNKGYKTEFPTTVVGAPSALKAPDVQPADQKAPETPQNDAAGQKDKVPEGMLRAPNWSEMYRIDPKRAKFDYGRAQNEAVLAQKEEAAQAKMELMQAKMEAKANTATSLDELQQLWKDNQRGLVQARKDQDKTSAAMYQGNIDRLLPILQEKAPAVWGNPPAKKAGEQPPHDGADGSQTPAGVPTPKQSALTEAYDKVDTLVDNDKNGTVDNLVAVDRAIKAIRDKYGVSDSDMQDVYNQIDLVKGQFSDEAERTRQKKQDDLDNSLKIQAAANTGGAVDARMAQTKIDALAKDPSSQPARSDAVLWIMRKNSGAMIGPNEILQYMQGKLPADKYAELTEKLSPTGMKALLGLVTNKLNDAQITKITADYIPYLQVDGILTDLGVYTNSKTPPPSGGGDTYPKYKTLNSGKKYMKKTANSAWEPVK